MNLLFFILIKVRCFYVHLHLFQGVLTVRMSQHLIWFESLKPFSRTMSSYKERYAKAFDRTAPRLKFQPLFTPPVRFPKRASAGDWRGQVR